MPVRASTMHSVTVNRGSAPPTPPATTLVSNTTEARTGSISVSSRVGQEFTSGSGNHVLTSVVAHFDPNLATAVDVSTQGVPAAVALRQDRPGLDAVA